MGNICATEDLAENNANLLARIARDGGYFGVPLSVVLEWEGRVEGTAHVCTNVIPFLAQEIASALQTVPNDGIDLSTRFRQVEEQQMISSTTTSVARNRRTITDTSNDTRASHEGDEDSVGEDSDPSSPPVFPARSRTTSRRPTDDDHDEEDRNEDRNKNARPVGMDEESPKDRLEGLLHAINATVRRVYGRGGGNHHNDHHESANAHSHPPQTQSATAGAQDSTPHGTAQTQRGPQHTYSIFQNIFKPSGGVGDNRGDDSCSRTDLLHLLLFFFMSLPNRPLPHAILQKWLSAYEKVDSRRRGGGGGADEGSGTAFPASASLRSARFAHRLSSGGLFGGPSSPSWSQHMDGNESSSAGAGSAAGRGIGGATAANRIAAMREEAEAEDAGSTAPPSPEDEEHQFEMQLANVFLSAVTPLDLSFECSRVENKVLALSGGFSFTTSSNIATSKGHHSASTAAKSAKAAKALQKEKDRALAHQETIQMILRERDRLSATEALKNRDLFSIINDIRNPDPFSLSGPGAIFTSFYCSSIATTIKASDALSLAAKIRDMKKQQQKKKTAQSSTGFDISSTSAATKTTLKKKKRQDPSLGYAEHHPHHPSARIFFWTLALFNELFPERQMLCFEDCCLVVASLLEYSRAPVRFDGETNTYRNISSPREDVGENNREEDDDDPTMGSLSGPLDDSSLALEAMRTGKSIAELRRRFIAVKVPQTPLSSNTTSPQQQSQRKKKSQANKDNGGGDGTNISFKTLYFLHPMHAIRVTNRVRNVTRGLLSAFCRLRPTELNRSDSREKEKEAERLREDKAEGSHDDEGQTNTATPPNMSAATSTAPSARHHIQEREEQGGGGNGRSSMYDGRDDDDNNESEDDRTDSRTATQRTKAVIEGMRKKGNEGQNAMAVAVAAGVKNTAHHNRMPSAAFSEQTHLSGPNWPHAGSQDTSAIVQTSSSSEERAGGHPQARNNDDGGSATYVVVGPPTAASDDHHSLPMHMISSASPSPSPASVSSLGQEAAGGRSASQPHQLAAAAPSSSIVHGANGLLSANTEYNATAAALADHMFNRGAAGDANSNYYGGHNSYHSQYYGRDGGALADSEASTTYTPRHTYSNNNNMVGAKAIVPVTTLSPTAGLLAEADAAFLTDGGGGGGRGYPAHLPNGGYGTKAAIDEGMGYEEEEEAHPFLFQGQPTLDRLCHLKKCFILGIPASLEDGVAGVENKGIAASRQYPLQTTTDKAAHLHTAQNKRPYRDVTRDAVAASVLGPAVAGAIKNLEHQHAVSGGSGSGDGGTKYQQQLAGLIARFIDGGDGAVVGGGIGDPNAKTRAGYPLNATSFAAARAEADARRRNVNVATALEKDEVVAAREAVRRVQIERDAIDREEQSTMIRSLAALVSLLEKDNLRLRGDLGQAMDDISDAMERLHHDHGTLKGMVGRSTAHKAFRERVQTILADVADSQVGITEDVNTVRTEVRQLREALLGTERDRNQLADEVLALRSELEGAKARWANTEREVLKQEQTVTVLDRRVAEALTRGRVVENDLKNVQFGQEVLLRKGAAVGGFPTPTADLNAGNMGLGLAGRAADERREARGESYLYPSFSSKAYSYGGGGGLDEVRGNLNGRPLYVADVNKRAESPSDRPVLAGGGASIIPTFADNTNEILREEGYCGSAFGARDR